MGGPAKAMTKAISLAKGPLKTIKKVFREPTPPPAPEPAAAVAPKYDPSKAVPIGDIIAGDEERKKRRRKRRGAKPTEMLTGAAGDTSEAPVLRKGLLGE